MDFLPEAHRQAPVLEARSEIRRMYEWDRSGRLVGMRDSERGQRTFTYDPRDQVTRVLCPERHLDEQYRYNALMDLTHSSGRPHRYEAGEVQYVGDTTYRRDTRGRVISKTAIRNGFRPQTWTYRWDDFDRLVETDTPEGETWRYTYDAFGRRVMKSCVTPGKQRTIRYLWQGATLIEELRETEAVTFRWHFEPGTFRPLAKEVQTREGQSFYPIVTDHLGTPKELFEESGECLWKADHSLWGKTETHVLRMKARVSWQTGDAKRSQIIECNLRFQNQWEDQETGLCYNLHRYYDPESGQYLSQDPIKLAGGMRTHGYVADPLSLVDPLGLAGCPSNLLTSEGEVGNYRTMRRLGSVGDDITPHHMPSDSYMKGTNISGYSRDSGITMNMQTDRHYLTNSYGASPDLSLSPRSSLAHDIMSTRSIYQDQGLYTPEIRQGLQQVIRQNKANFPDAFAKR